MASNETKHLEPENKLTDLSKKVSQISEKGYDFLLGRMYFAGDDDYYNFLVFTSMFNSLTLDNDNKVVN